MLGKRNKQRLEAACQHIINAGVTPSCTGVKRAMVAIDSDDKKPVVQRRAASNRKPEFVPVEERADGPSLATAATPAGAYIRGADYYRRLNEERGR